MVETVPYVEVLEAQEYFDDARLHAEAWDGSDDIRRLKALKSASIMIDRLNFKGVKSDPLQQREFPRVPGYGMISRVTTVPNDIKIATCELALTLLDGVDPDLEEEDLGAITEAYATVRITSDPNVRKDHIKAGIPSTIAWKHLLPYLNDPLEIHVRRG